MIYHTIIYVIFLFIILLCCIIFYSKIEKWWINKVSSNRGFLVASIVIIYILLFIPLLMFETPEIKLNKRYEFSENDTTFTFMILKEDTLQDNSQIKLYKIKTSAKLSSTNLISLVDKINDLGENNFSAYFIADQYDYYAYYDVTNKKIQYFDNKYELISIERDYGISNKAIVKVIIPEEYNREQIFLLSKTICDAEKFHLVNIFFYKEGMDVDNVCYASFNNLDGQDNIEIWGHEIKMSEIDLSKEILIGEWTFNDEMGTFKEKLIYSFEKKGFYQKSYLPGGGWVDGKIGKVRKEGTRYVIGKSNDIYYINKDGSMTWTNSDYSDVIGYGNCNKELLEKYYLEQQ